MSQLFPEYEEHPDYINEIEQQEKEHIIMKPETEDEILGKCRIYGSYEQYQIPLDRQEKITKAMDSIDEVMFPTLSQLRKKANFLELQGRIYRMLKPYEKEVNRCVQSAKSVAQVNYCCDVFVEKLMTECKLKTFDILRDY